MRWRTERMDRGKGINNGDLKRRNRGLALKLIATGESNTRTGIARASRLTKMSVSNIIDELIQKDLIVEGEQERGEQQGRRPLSLEFSPKAPKMIGVLINREYCAAVLCDFHLNVIRTERREMDYHEKGWLLENIYGLIDSMLEVEKNILGIGVASIGPLDVVRGMILRPPRFYGIRDLPLASLLKERYGLPVFMDHQYNSAARAEKLFGCGKEFSSFIFVGITNGIGAGIYLDGGILQNRAGLGSELGHISVDYQGNLCDCGSRGCVETYAGTNAIVSRVEAATGKKMTFAECCAHSHEAVIRRILTEALEKLSICLVSVSNLLNPEAIILGHESVKLPEEFLKEMEGYINRYKLSEDSGESHIKLQKPYFGEDSQLVGAACNVLAQAFEGKLLFE